MPYALVDTLSKTLWDISDDAEAATPSYWILRLDRSARLLPFIIACQGYNMVILRSELRVTLEALGGDVIFTFAPACED